MTKEQIDEIALRVGKELFAEREGKTYNEFVMTFAHALLAELAKVGEPDGYCVGSHHRPQGEPYSTMYDFAKAAWDRQQLRITELENDIDVQDALIKKQGEGSPYFNHYQQALGKIDVLQIRARVLEDGIKKHLEHHENGCVFLSHLIAHNA